MSAHRFQLERRAAQRFDVRPPVAVRLSDRQREGCGFTRNLSARDALFHNHLPMSEADAIEFTLVMPAKITLAGYMRVKDGRLARPTGPGTPGLLRITPTRLLCNRTYFA
jgi:hypothetical protein